MLQVLSTLELVNSFLRLEELLLEYVRKLETNRNSKIVYDTQAPHTLFKI